VRFFLARLGVFACQKARELFSANTVTGKSARSHPGHCLRGGWMIWL